MLALEWALFREFAVREITWSYPVGMDQAGYLHKSYIIHERVWAGGLPAGLRSAFDPAMPQGFLLQLEAAILYLFVGPSRLSALALNFLHFAALQCLLVLALRTLHRGWSLAALGVGLLLCAILPFERYGGMADFRLDFPAACLFGMFAAAGVCSDGWRRRGWTLATVALGTVCIWTRHIAITYVLGVLGAFVLFALLRRGASERGPAVRRAILVAAAVAALTTPVLWANRKALHDYYVVGHVTGAEKGLRARQFGVKTIADALAFYPLSVARDHTGPAYLWTAGLASAAALLSLTPWVRRRRDAVPTEPLAIDPTNGLAFLALCIAVPIAVLTANQSKSPVVGGVVVPPLTLLVALGAWLALGRDAAGLRTLKVLGALAVAVGLWSYVGGVVRPIRSPQDRTDSRTMIDIYDELARYTQDAGWRRIRIASTVLQEPVWPAVPAVLFYERHRWLPEFEVTGFTIFEPDPKGFLDGVRGSDIVLLREPLRGPTLFPFDKAMRRLHPELRALCDREFFLLKRVNVFGAGLSVYVRPAASAEGASGDWISASGLRLRAKPELLAEWPRLRFAGGWMPGSLRGHTPRVCATLDVDGRPQVAVPARLSVDGATYTVDVDVPSDAVRSAADASVHVVFDTYFSGAPVDPRRLVVLAPERVPLLRIDGDAISAAPCPFDMANPVDVALPSPR